MSIKNIIRPLIGGLMAAVGTALPLAADGQLTLPEILSAVLAGLLGTGLTAYSPSGSPSSQPAVGPVVAPGVIGEVEKIAVEAAPLVEGLVPEATPVIAAVEGALGVQTAP